MSAINEDKDTVHLDNSSASFEMPYKFVFLIR